jgi:hypothetical protein
VYASINCTVDATGILRWGLNTYTGIFERHSAADTAGSRVLRDVFMIPVMDGDIVDVYVRPITHDATLATDSQIRVYAVTTA